MKVFGLTSSLLLACILSFASIAVEPPAMAKTPDQNMLINLINGNTLNGEWAGRPFRQFFSASGTTKYKEGNGSVSNGSWRVNKKGQYCSVWAPSPTEACYDVLVDGIDVYWKSTDTYYPSTVTQGNSF